MIIPDEFDDIRPYSPEELPAVFEELLADEQFCGIVKYFYPEVPMDLLKQKLCGCRDNLEFQKTFIAPLLHNLVEKCCTGFEMDASAIADKSINYTYVSNHRDIVLDSAFLSILLLKQGFPSTVEIAIGDNLLIYPWIKKLVRVNKSFIVQRSLSMREMLMSSQRMSKYMHFAIADKHESIWIAQREGRAKDANDRTQESVLKMMAMGGEGSVVERLASLNICPVSISYEFDPCDYLKAKEFQQKRDIEGFKKSREDDLINMKTGIFGYKGHIHYQLTPCINTWLPEVANLPKGEIFAEIARRMDQAIHAGYRLYPINYVACDWLSGTEEFAAHYTAEEKQQVVAYVNERVAMVDLPNKDEDFLRTCILNMYANPLRNQMAAQ